MPLKDGYSYGVVQDNAREMMRSGHPRNQAAAASFAHARVCFFRRHPQGALPAWLAYPTSYRLREHYNAHGAPIMGMHARVLTNPRNAPRNSEMKKAVKLYEGFTGRRATAARKIKLPPQPRAGVVLGQLVQVGYISDRDGQPYRHTFRAIRSRPLLIASSDGKQALIVGGRFVITDRGLEDR